MIQALKAYLSNKHKKEIHGKKRKIVFDFQDRKFNNFTISMIL